MPCDWRQRALDNKQKKAGQTIPLSPQHASRVSKREYLIQHDRRKISSGNSVVPHSMKQWQTLSLVLCAIRKNIFRPWP